MLSCQTNLEELIAKHAGLELQSAAVVSQVVELQSTLEETSAAKAHLEQTSKASKAELENVKTKLGWLKARLAYAEWSSGSGITSPYGIATIVLVIVLVIVTIACAVKLEQAHAAKAEVEETSRAELEDVKAKLEQASAAPLDFPVETIVQEDRKVIAIQCPGVTIHDFRVEYDGLCQGEIQIDRKEALGVQPVQWTWKINFDSYHEFLLDEIRPGFAVWTLWTFHFCFLSLSLYRL